MQQIHSQQTNLGSGNVLGTLDFGSQNLELKIKVKETFPEHSSCVIKMEPENMERSYNVWFPKNTFCVLERSVFAGFSLCHFV